MRSLSACRLLNKHCRHHEEWHCGRVSIRFTGKDINPRFDRRIDIFLDQKPAEVEVRKSPAFCVSWTPGT